MLCNAGKLQPLVYNI